MQPALLVSIVQGIAGKFHCPDQNFGKILSIDYQRNV